MGRDESAKRLVDARFAAHGFHHRFFRKSGFTSLTIDVGAPDAEEIVTDITLLIASWYHL